MLYVVPTPIGNLKDITFRAIEVLQSVEIILCEDTRTSSKLLQHYQINKLLWAFHQHNEHKMLAKVLDKLLNNIPIAIITDAGTPGISDPAFLLVRACIENNIQVQTLPGATAFVPALINSGLPTNQFIFVGFLPLKKGRQTLLKSLSLENKTIILYESPMRLLKTLHELVIYFGKNRKASISREISKLYEENFQGSLEKIIAHFSLKPIKGELVIVIEGVQ